MERVPVLPDAVPEAVADPYAAANAADEVNPAELGPIAGRPFARRNPDEEPNFGVLRARSFRAERDLRGNCCKVIFIDTMGRNKALCVFSMLMWGFFAGFFAIWADHGFNGAALGLFITFCVIYGIFFITFVMIGGCSPLCMACCTVSSSCCVNDYVVEAVQAEASSSVDNVRGYLAALHEATPELRLHVTCSHTVSTGSGKRRRTRTVVTYRGSKVIDLVSHRDLSVTPAVYAAAVAADPASYACVTYDLEWDGSEETKARVEREKTQYYMDNRHRDTSCSVSLVYSLGPERRMVDVLCKDEGCRYYLANFFINRCCMYLAMYASLYLPYICLWKCLVRPFRYTNTKYIVV